VPRYRKKPIEIDAIRVSIALKDAGRHWDRVPDWLRDAYERGTVLFLTHAINIATGHADDWATAEAGDWIIRGVQGELYPCKPDIFDATYEEV
jgi:hypothetical protein